MKTWNWRLIWGLASLCTCAVLLATADFLKAWSQLQDYHVVTYHTARGGKTTDGSTGVLYNYTFSPTTICKSDVDILIFVFSSPQNVQNRNTIRQTWGSMDILQQYNTKLVFIMGQPEPEFDWVDYKTLQREYETFGDILQDHFVDSYKNLTMKSNSMIHWVLTYCESPKYIVKVDEDVILNIPGLRKTLAQNNCQHCLVGQVISGATPVRDRRTKWYTPAGMYSGDTYPDYLSGTAYVLPKSLLPRLYDVILNTKYFWLEDVYITGICAPKAGGKLVDNAYFNGILTRNKPVCDHRLISSHGFTPLNMNLCWKKIKGLI